MPRSFLPRTGRPTSTAFACRSTAGCPLGSGKAQVMRAVVKTGAGRGCEFVTDRVEPSLLPGQVRVQVAAASVCGSDAAFYEYGDAGGGMGMTFPRPLGQEMGGTA